MKMDRVANAHQIDWPVVMVWLGLMLIGGCSLWLVGYLLRVFL